MVRNRTFINARKIKKLVKNPGIFMRDFLFKKFPYTNTQLDLTETKESVVVDFLDTRERLLDELIEPVDVVYTWVNHQDEIWQKTCLDAKKEWDPHSKDFFSVDAARFCNHNELFYSIISVKRFMPWVRKIFVVTAQQIPEWREAHSDVEFVFHDDIVDSIYLPTFNSHVIEAFLYKIPDLSENFIYFNDDVFVAKNLHKNHFFSANGLSSLFVADKTLDIPKTQSDGINSNSIEASVRSANLLRQTHSIKIQQKLVHTYYPLKKSMFELAWNLYEKEINSFLTNKFRGDNDINLSTFLIPWLTYCEGKAKEAVDICYYFNIRSPHAIFQYEKLLTKKEEGKQPHSFCANDFVSSLTTLQDYHKNLENMLQRYFG